MSCCGLPPFWRFSSKKQNAWTSSYSDMSDMSETSKLGSGNHAAAGKTRTASPNLYGVLKRHEIRLLTFKSLNSSNPMELQMQTVALGALAYDALSYAWGETGEKQSIKVNDHTIEITANLYEALEAIRRNMRRSTSPTNGTSCFWVDAICIDQSHSREKGQQVAMMGKIYSKAENVPMWLGPADVDDNIAMRFLERWDSLLSSNPDVQAARQHGKVQQEGLDRLSKSILRDVDRAGRERFLGLDRLKAIERFSNRPYFGRIWTLQEQVLAKKGTLMCGKRAVPASTLWSVAVVLFHLGSKHNPQPATAMVDLFPSLRLRLGCSKASESVRDDYLSTLDDRLSKRSLTSQCYFHGDDPVLHLILENPRQVQSSDPRDRIFGLLGLVPDSKRRPIEPDYSLDVSQVYMKYWTAELQKTNGVRILGIASSQVEDDSIFVDLPSWVPDFRGRLQDYVEWNSRTHSQNKYPKDGTGPSFSVSLDGRELTLQGYLFDRIEGVYDFHSHSESSEQIWKCVDFIFKNYRKDPYSIRQADCPWTVALFHAFMASRRNNDVDEALILKDPKIRHDVALYYSILTEWAIVNYQLYQHESAISFLMPPEADYDEDLLLHSAFHSKEGRETIYREVLVQVAVALGLDREIVDSFPPATTGPLREINGKGFTKPTTSKWKQQTSPRSLLLSRDGYIGGIELDARKGDVICLVRGCPRSLILRPCDDNDDDDDDDDDNSGQDADESISNDERFKLIGRANFPFMSLQTEYLTDPARICLV